MGAGTFPFSLFPFNRFLPGNVCVKNDGRSAGEGGAEPAGGEEVVGAVLAALGLDGVRDHVVPLGLVDEAEVTRSDGLTVARSDRVTV